MLGRLETDDGIAGDAATLRLGAAAGPSGLVDALPLVDDAPAESAQTATVRLPIGTKLFYGIGGVPFGIKDSSFSYLLLIYYNQVVGLPSRTVGFAIMIAMLIDAFVDVSVGVVSDHWRSRWGRRHPFMYVTALPLAISYLFIWRMPAHMSDGWTFAYLLVVIVTVRSLMSLFEIPSTALGAELTSNYDERTKLSSYRTLLGWWAGLVAVLMAFQVFLRPDTQHPVGLLNPEGFVKFGYFGAAAMFVSILVSSIGTHSRIKTLHVPVMHSVTMRQKLRELTTALSDRSFLAVTFSGLFIAVGLGVGLALNLYFNTYFWGLSNDQISLIAVVNFGSAVLSFFLAPMAGRYFDKKPAAIAMRIVAFGIHVSMVSLRLFGVLPGNGSPLIFDLLLVTALFGAAFSSVSIVLMASMILDVADAAELRTGRRFEGLFVSATSFMQKAVSGIGIFVSGMILWLIGFPAHAMPGHVAPHILWKLGALDITLLAACYVPALLLLSLYGITREKHEETLRKIAEMRRKAAGVPRERAILPNER